MKRNDNRPSWMEKYAPPGINLAQEVLYWVMTMTVSTFWTMSFLYNYHQHLQSLYETRGSKRILVEGAMMPTFEALTENLFEIFFLVVAYCVIIAAYHYFYHYQGSKMMYLMKRLPNKWEVHIRCLILPVSACGIAMIYMVLLKAIYYAIYLFCTPSKCLPL